MFDTEKFLIEIGSKLRLHRESLGKNIELVSLETELPMEIIQGIEDGKEMEIFTYVDLLDYYELPRGFLFE